MYLRHSNTCAGRGVGFRDWGYSCPVPCDLVVDMNPDCCKEDGACSNTEELRKLNVRITHLLLINERLEAELKAERERCCQIVFGQCGSDNVAQRTVDAIRG